MVPLRIDDFFNFIKMSLKAGNIFKKPTTMNDTKSTKLQAFLVY